MEDLPFVAIKRVIFVSGVLYRPFSTLTKGYSPSSIFIFYAEYHYPWMLTVTDLYYRSRCLFP